MDKSSYLTWPYQIQITDWARILFGETPASFFIEVIIRLVIIFALIVVSMRLMGKRMASRLSRNELAAMVVLAAGVGVPIQSPDRGILPGFIIAAIVILTQRGISLGTYNNQKFEKYSQGDIATLVSDGVMDLKAMEKVRVSRDRLMAEVRSKSITNMGKVSRIYMEAGGSFSVVEQEQEQPGLPVVPEWDAAFYKEENLRRAYPVCGHCGLPQQRSEDPQVCSNCSSKKFIPAVMQ